MAQGLLEKLAAASGIEGRLRIDSAGTHPGAVGLPPADEAIEALRHYDIDISAQRSRAVVEEDFSRFDFLLAMERPNVDYLRYVAPAGSTARLEVLSASRWRQVAIPDPYRQGPAAFARTAKLLEKALLRWSRPLCKQLSERVE